MRISKAFPRVLERQYPIVKSDYPLLTVLYLLRMRDIDAVPIAPLTKEGSRAVFGFSSLPQFLSLGPRGFAEYLRGPCRAASSELAAVSVGEELESLLEAFRSRRLGFALVHDGGVKKKMRASLVSLSDVLGLYGGGMIRSEMRAEDVGTRVFALPGDTDIREALQAMFKHHVRRVFIEGERNYVSDRSIMNHLFNPMTLESLGQKDERDVLSTPIARIEKSSPATVDSKTSVKAAALKLVKDRGGCLVTEDDKVVTPWDVAMKPWQSGKLAIQH